MLRKLFIDHPSSVQESYGEHALVATSFGVRMLLGGMACLVHAIVPGLFVRTGSGIITVLHDEMVVNRNRKAPRVPTGASAADTVG
ncbi:MULTISPECIES: DUF6356 family protein [Nitrospirillum]|uniref:Type 1 capsular polysaccharide biosynthesis protein J n=1 Tax=Nitrospirillum amazonense TaxID=28077 RepID=A0A560GQ20_9PROT|nr:MULTISPECIES: DUF6356 family protein [Nitrospirillum]MDZ5650747.1 DUF6356 family protein [Nitrospirillum sp. BR 11828]MEE3624901.1 DUF6356 family protein [Nitrospirillum sp. BR 11752]TWB35759.1 hypothetical protein FBZ90_11944 [Nitrospirillum amazonense]